MIEDLALIKFIECTTIFLIVQSVFISDCFISDLLVTALLESTDYMFIISAQILAILQLLAKITKICVPLKLLNKNDIII